MSSGFLQGEGRRRWLAWAGHSLVGAGLQGAVGGASAQANAGVTEAQVLVGQVLTLDGGRNDQGMAVRQGVEAARRQINAAGGVWGRQLAVRLADDRGKADLAEIYARQLANEGALLLFGPTEPDPAMAVMQAANQTRLPLFGPMAGWPVVRQPGMPLIFPVRAEPREEFRALLAQGRSQGMRRAAFLQSDTDLGRLHLDSVRQLATAGGVSEVLPLVVPATGPISEEAIDAMVRQLKDHRTEFMFNHGDAGFYERLIRRARAAGLTLSFLGVSAGAASLVQGLGGLAQTMVFSQVVPNPWDRVNALSREYQDAFRAVFREQEFSYASLEGYVTLRALAEALRQTGRDLSRPALLRTLGDVDLDVAGYRLRYQGSERAGSTFVDTTIVTREGRFRH